jgi:hypothetical protein
VFKLISLVASDGDARPGGTEIVASGLVFPDTARCHAQPLPRRVPHGCIAYRQTEPPSPELLSRVLEGLKRL